MKHEDFGYAQGESIQRDVGNAREYFQKAAEGGDPKAMCEMALRSNEKKGFQWAKKAYETCLAQKSDTSNAAFLVGIMYRYGYGVKKDLNAGVSYFRQSAEAGNTEAMCNLGEMYRRGLGVKPDMQESLRWYEKAAAQNDWKALESLGDMFAKGIGVSQDGAKAVVWRERLARLGNEDAMIQLAQMYEKGNGIEKDMSKAVSWYERAATEGSCEAMEALGGIYKDGELAEPDGKKAVEWYEKAAATGDAGAMIMLGKMYEEAKAVEEDRDKAKAKAWYEKAVEAGASSAFEMFCNLCNDKDELLEWCRRCTKINTRWRVWNAIDVYFQDGRDENIEHLKGSNCLSKINRSWEIIREVESERKAQAKATFQRCGKIIDNLNDALADLYEESLDMEAEETLETYKETAVRGYEEAIEYCITQLEGDGDKKQAEILRQKMLSVILSAFGLKVSKKSESLLQGGLLAITDALYKGTKGWETMYGSRDWMIRSCVREWMKMLPES